MENAKKQIPITITQIVHLIVITFILYIIIVFLPQRLFMYDIESLDHPYHYWYSKKHLGTYVEGSTYFLLGDLSNYFLLYYEKKGFFPEYPLPVYQKYYDEWGTIIHSEYLINSSSEVRIQLRSCGLDKQKNTDDDMVYMCGRKFNENRGYGGFEVPLLYNENPSSWIELLVEIRDSLLWGQNKPSPYFYYDYYWTNLNDHPVRDFWGWPFYEDTYEVVHGQWSTDYL